MAATIWSKFFWSDWQADPALRACSLAARGLWMEMLCIAAGERGYLVRDGDPLPANTLANIVGQPLATVEMLIAELEENRVFSRDRRGRIYSRRMVREAKHIESSRKGGKKGGIASHEKKKGIFAPSHHPLDMPSAPISHKPESISQMPAARSQQPSGRAGEVLLLSQERTLTPLLQRAAAAMRTDANLLLRRPAWAALPAFVVDLVAQGCDADRDIWPVMERLAARLAEPPVSPAYFREAILESRAKTAAARAWVPSEEWEGRLRVFTEHGVWTRKWGPKPGEPGCQAPEAMLAEAV